MMYQYNNTEYEKLCSCCNESKLAEPNFHKDEDKEDGYSTRCKQCISKINKINRKKILKKRKKTYQYNNSEYQKKCPICGETKLAEPNFYKSKQNFDGYKCYCKKCKSQKDKVYKSTPRGKLLTQLNWMIWKANNRDKVRENNRKATRKYVEKNREIIKIKNRGRHNNYKLKLVRMISNAKPQTLWEKYSSK